MKEIKDDLDLFLPGGYVAPQSKESIVDQDKGTVQDIKDLPPLEQIRVASKRFNIPLNDAPKKNCKKCYERGYTGFNADKSPIPCNCLFPKKVENEKEKNMVPLSCLPKKAQRKYMREKKKQLAKNIRSESTIRQLRKAREEFLSSLTSGAEAEPVKEILKESEVNDGREVTQG